MNVNCPLYVALPLQGRAVFESIADELECGLRREGAFMGVYSFVQKCATSLGALWVGPGLTLVGYEGQAPIQSDRTLLLMRLMYVFPVVFNIFVMVR